MSVLYLHNYEHVGPSRSSFMDISEIPVSNWFMVGYSTTNGKELL